MSEQHVRYAVHAYAWTSSWSSEDLGLVDHAASLGLDALEIPLMELDGVDPAALRERAEHAGIGLLTSVACADDTDPSSEDDGVREAGLDFLRRCVDATAAMGADIFTGVTYSALGRRIDRRPTADDTRRAAEVLREVARHAAGRAVTVGIEPVNRYETFLVNTAAQGVELMELIDEPNVGIHLDAYHMNLEEEDFRAPVELAAEHLIHFHLSESHRGIPGQGTVAWEAIMGALADHGYTGYVGLESFAEVSDAMRGATCIWRDLAPSSDVLVREGLSYLKDLHRAASA
jgi:D-psicose/D-tagatose/L-ribulose 3-epimerase